jgi:ATP-dependent DNA helicase RecG
VNESYRERLHAFIQKQCAEGGQVYVVCPAVEEREAEIDELLLDEIGDTAPIADDRPPLKAAVQYAKELQEALLSSNFHYQERCYQLALCIRVSNHE